MPKTANSVQRKIQDGASRAAKCPVVRAKPGLASAASRRREAVQPYWWILRGDRPNAS